MVEILSAAAARGYHYYLYLPSPPPVTQYFSLSFLLSSSERVL
jgi:hypothetical protein